MDGEFLFKNGERVTDKVSDFHGTIVSRADAIDGYRQYEVQPPGRPDAPQDAKWFAEGRLQRAE